MKELKERELLIEEIRDGLDVLGYDTIIRNNHLITINSGITHEIPIENIMKLMEDELLKEHMNVNEMINIIKTFHDMKLNQNKDE